MISETGLATAGVIYSELILSLYPILIQGIDTSLFTQYVSRFLIYPLCAILIGGFGDFWKAWGNTSAAYQSIGLGLLNLIHVGTSYIAFANLLPGLAISLFYLYPIFNIIAGNLFFNEKLSPYIGAILVLAFIGTILIATSANENINAKDGKINTKKMAEGGSVKTKRSIGSITKIFLLLVGSIIILPAESLGIILVSSDLYVNPFVVYSVNIFGSDNCNGLLFIII